VAGFFHLIVSLVVLLAIGAIMFVLADLAARALFGWNLGTKVDAEVADAFGAKAAADAAAEPKAAPAAPAAPTGNGTTPN